MLKIIVDTNLLVPSIYQHTLLMQLIVSGGFFLCLSPDLCDEAREKIDVLGPRLGGRRTNKVSASQAHFVLDTLEAIAKHEGYYYHVRCPDWYQADFPDTDDRCFLWVAEKLSAEYIITGDNQLLDLSRHGSTVICRLNDFWNQPDVETLLARVQQRR